MRVPIDDCQQTNIILAYEAVPWTHPEVTAFYVMNTLMGNATSFSSGGPGKGMYCRAIVNLMQRYHFVSGVTTINSHFSDSGIFGISINGPAEAAQSLLQVMA